MSPVKLRVNDDAVLMVRPWEAPDLEAKRFSTVDQADIRGLLRPKAGAEPHDLDSSGAASI